MAEVKMASSKLEVAEVQLHQVACNGPMEACDGWAADGLFSTALLLLASVSAVLARFQA